jgi:predicted permease
VIRTGIRRALSLALRRRDRWEREVEEEIRLHLTLRAEQLIGAGRTPEEAYAEAVERFGPLTESRARLLAAAQHRERQMQRTEYLADLRHDMAFARRTLGRDKGWTAVAILTLALGIGATTAVFSVVSSLLLHAVPYPDANRVVVVYQQPTKGNNTGINVTVTPAAPVFRAWRAGARSFESLEPIARGEKELATTTDPATLNVAQIEPTFPKFAGSKPIVGRLFTASEIAAKAPVALLGEGVWRSRFGADPRVTDKTITLDDQLYNVIGVLPASLRAPEAGAGEIDAWLPLDVRDDNIGTMVVGRLRPGASAEVAQRELDSAYARTTSANGGASRFHAVVTTPAKRVHFHDSLVMLVYAVALVLLVACSNVAHLMLARTTSRQREFAIRAALGAGRGRVFRQLLTESMMLGGLGCAAGVFVGWVGLTALIALRPTALSALESARLDGTTLMIAIAVTLCTSVAFGVFGALQSARVSTHDALKSGAMRGSGGGSRARTALVVTEMALSGTLLIGAAMLVRSVMNLQQADVGFQPRGLYSVSLSAPRNHFKAPGSRGELLHTIAARLSAMPGIQSVALASTPPAWFSFTIGRFEIEGEPRPAEATTQFVDVNQVQTGYFKTMGIRLVHGGAFTDTTRAANQVIVNEKFARKHWGSTSPVGKRIRVAQKDDTPWLTIVGVATDAATWGPLRESTAPFLYTPATDSEVVAIMVRTNGSAATLEPLQALVRSLDSRTTVKIQSVIGVLSDSISTPRFIMLLLTTFTVLGLSLAAVGLYGVMAYAVAQRTREFGIRVALGATGARIARGVVGRGVALALIGSSAAIVIGAYGTKVIEKELFGVARSDVTSFALAVVVLVVVAIIACVVPARRALAVDPMTAIRAD